jgi:hypothetical protein
MLVMPPVSIHRLCHVDFDLPDGLRSEVRGTWSRSFGRMLGVRLIGFPKH